MSSNLVYVEHDAILDLTEIARSHMTAAGFIVEMVASPVFIIGEEGFPQKMGTIKSETIFTLGEAFERLPRDQVIYLLGFFMLPARRVDDDGEVLSRFYVAKLRFCLESELRELPQ